MSLDQFTVIGENLHTTRILLRKGKRITAQGGVEGVAFVSEDGHPGFLPISASMQASQAYREGRVQHIALAVATAMGKGTAAETAREYLHRVTLDQERAGAHYLDVNVDEISLRTPEQRQAMAWLVDFVRSVTTLPISVDSSDISVIETGLAAAAAGPGPSMLNSASLERTEAVGLAKTFGARVIVTAAGAEGMPADAAERIDNASDMVEKALEAGIAIGDIFLDPLVFPISVDSSFGLHTLEAIRTLRRRFGPDIHITGGMSNVSFGIPARQLMNTVFINLTVEAGADSGIIDPVANPLGEVFAADRESEPYRLAEDVLLGRDEFCMKYITAWRQGALST